MFLKIIIYIYYLLGFLLGPLYFVFFLIRIFNDKEDTTRILERFGIQTKKYILASDIIWVHAASIGESLAALTLIKEMRLDKKINIHATQGIKFLITTCTKSSSELLKNKLPSNTIHQFLPIDNIIFIRNFLRFWKPRISIFIESEIWPGIIYESSKRSSLLLFNARLSDKSFRLWKKGSFLFKMLLARFKEIIVQSDEDLKKFQTFVSGKVINLGNIKFSNKKLEINAKDSDHLISMFKDRKVVLFASTHSADDNIIFNTIKPIRKIFHDSYFIIVLRHPHRAGSIEKLCKKLKLTFNVRGIEKSLPNLKNDLYLVDTFDELGVFYYIAYITFVGGSFADGGHSPLEASHFNNVIMFGPDMSSCQDIANLMIVNKAAIQITNQMELQHLIEYFLTEKNSTVADSYKHNALNFVNSYQQVVQHYLAIVEKYV